MKVNVLKYMLNRKWNKVANIIEKKNDMIFENNGHVKNHESMIESIIGENAEYEKQIIVHEKLLDRVEDLIKKL